jgi:hypothetical protein
MSLLLFTALLLGLVVPLGIGWVVSASLAGTLAIVSVVLSNVVLAIVCGVVLTGHVYMRALGGDGTLKTWGVANKVVAALLLAGALFFLVRQIAA